MNTINRIRVVVVTVVTLVGLVSAIQNFIKNRKEEKANRLAARALHVRRQQAIRDASDWVQEKMDRGDYAGKNFTAPLNDLDFAIIVNTNLND